MAHIAQIIQYEGDNSTFVWKHPAEDFNSMTQLIVHESQEALFFLNGEALDLFGAGRYTLETQNIPKIGKYLNKTTNGNTPFHCEVYFINKTVQMGLKWGTDSKVRYIDPESGVPLELGASGEMNMQVVDSRKLLVKLIGTMNGIAWEAQGSNFTKSIQSSFRPLISTAVKSNLTSAIKEKNINILEVDEHLTELSDVLRSKMEPGFLEYGLSIPQFYLTTVVFPEDDPSFKRIRELHTISLQKRMVAAEAEIKTAQALAEADVTAARRQIELERQTTQTEIARREAERRVIEAHAEAEAVRAGGMAEAEVMRAKGYTEKDVLEAEVQKAYAEGFGNYGANGGGSGSGGSGIASDMVSMMAGMKVAGVMMDKMDGMMGGLSGSTQKVPETSEKAADTASGPEMVICPICGAKLPAGAKFCFECGNKVVLLKENEMICPVCGKVTPRGKFCMECGAPLVRKCPTCGAELPDGAKFCLECGTKI